MKGKLFYDSTLETYAVKSQGRIFEITVLSLKQVHKFIEKGNIKPSSEVIFKPVYEGTGGKVKAEIQKAIELIEGEKDKLPAATEKDIEAVHFLISTLQAAIDCTENDIIKLSWVNEYQTYLLKTLVKEFIPVISIPFNYIDGENISVLKQHSDGVNLVENLFNLAIFIEKLPNDEKIKSLARIENVIDSIKSINN